MNSCSAGTGHMKSVHVLQNTPPHDLRGKGRGGGRNRDEDVTIGRLIICVCL